MGAFILAGVIVIGTLGLCAVEFMAAAMSDATNGGDCGLRATFTCGMLLAGIVAATHWLPSIGW